MAIVTRFPTTNAAYSGAGFTNPNNLHADDGVYGTAAPAKNGALGTRYGTFGFDGQIPVGSTINAVKIIYEFKLSTTGSIATQRVLARIGGIAEEAHDNTNEPTTDTAVTVDITADRAWARDDLLDGTFEAVAEARRGNTNTGYTASWDQIKVEVTYTAPTTFEQSLGASGVGSGSTGKQLSLKTALQATAIGAGVLATGLVFQRALAALAVGSASTTRVLAYGVSLVATAAGTGATQAGLVLRRTLSASVSAIASVEAYLDEYTETVVGYVRCWVLGRRRHF